MGERGRRTVYLNIQTHDHNNKARLVALFLHVIPNIL